MCMLSRLLSKGAKLVALAAVPLDLLLEPEDRPEGGWNARMFITDAAQIAVQSK
jgi:hypothetical protein